jgi:hypothetical protein
MVIEIWASALTDFGFGLKPIRAGFLYPHPEGHG